MIIILAAGLRFAALTFDSLWLDEGYQTVVESYGNSLPDLFNPNGLAFVFSPGHPTSINNMLANFRHIDPLCPPLYAVFINRWLTIFGGSDGALRSLSVIFSLLSIVTTYIFASLLLNKRAALYASLLQTISPFDIYYAQEARMYSLSCLLATLSIGSLIYLCLKKTSSIWWLMAAIYIFSTWALVNTHYVQLFTWLFAILLGLGIALIRKNWSFLGRLVIFNLCVIILFIPWLPLLIEAVSVHNNSFYVLRPPNFLWPIWALFIRIPINWLTFLIGKKVMLFALPAYLTALFILGSALFLAKKQKSFLALLLISWALVPAIFLWATDVIESHRIIEITRYLIGTAPAIFLLAGYTCDKLSSWRYFMPFLLIHSGFCLMNNAYQHLVLQKEDWRGAAKIVEQSCQPNELLFVSPYYNIVCLDRYLHFPCRQIGVDPSINSEKIQELISKNCSQKDHIVFWVLSGQNGDTIFNAIPKNFKLIELHTLAHAVHLHKYQSN